MPCSHHLHVKGEDLLSGLLIFISLVAKSQDDQTAETFFMDRGVNNFLEFSKG